MKVVIAPDSFKDALRAAAAAQSIATGLWATASEVKIEFCPIADGGEGFTDAISLAYGANTSSRFCMSVDPLGRTIETNWLEVTRQAAQRSGVVELAAASGLERLSTIERDPTLTSTYGTGAMMFEALESGADEILLGIGGSATNDGGCGIAQALGVKFMDAKGGEIDRPITGAMLSQIARVDVSGWTLKQKSCALRLACDVNNPLTGPSGAAHTYGPQKGATSEQVEQLDAGLRHIAQLWREQLGVDVEQLPGAGAAGGVGGGLVAMLGAELVPGAQLVLDTIGFDAMIRDADLVITGEGRLDSQSLSGKAAMAVARRCKAAGSPCVALVGSVGQGAEQALDHGLTAYHVIGPGLDPAESIRRTGELLEQAAAKLIRDWVS